MWKFTDLCISK